MDRAKIPYHSDTEGFIRSLGHEGELEYISDHSADESYEYDISNIDEDYYLVEDFTSFKDVARSKKFYLKKKAFNEPKINELEDVFMKKLAEDESDSEEEKILQVVWSEDDPVQNKLVRFVEALDIKKSNSKFTLSMLDEERISADIESIEGEEIKGRFLEVKDSLEVLATSSRNLHGCRYSDWDFTIDEDPEVNRIWRKSDSQWTSSLQIEIGKLPSQADQETVLQVLDDGAQGKISVRDVTECLGNLLESANLDKDGYPSKKVSFCAVPSKSCLSKESLSQTSTQSGRSSSHKKVSFYTETFDDNFDDLVDKSNKKVSFYELAYDDDLELLSQSENGKIKKAVSFHDSVDFEKVEKSKEIDSSTNDSSHSEANADIDSAASTDKSNFNERVGDCYNMESDHSGLEKSTVSDTAASGYSLAESFSTLSTRTSFNGSMDVSECQDASDFSLHSSKHEDRVMPVHLLKFLNDQIHNLSPSLESDTDSKFGDYSTSSKGTEDKIDQNSINKILADVSNEIQAVIKDLRLDWQGESNADKIEFVRNLLEDSLNKKFDENDNSKTFDPSKNIFIDEDNGVISNGIGQTIKILYDHCKDMVDIDNLSKSMGLAMAFDDSTLHYLTVGSSEFVTEKDLYQVPDLYSAQENDKELQSVNMNLFCADPLNQRQLEPTQYDESYMSADSDGDLQVNRVTTSDLSLSFTLNKYIYTDYPPFIDDATLWCEGRNAGFKDQMV